MTNQLPYHMTNTIHGKTIHLPNSNTSFDMMEVEGGIFDMGEGNGKHKVQLSTFFIGKYLVTQSFWRAVMQDVAPTPSRFLGDDRPVERVSWFDAAVFCNRLNEILSKEPCYFADKGMTILYGKTGQGYSLPNKGEVYTLHTAKGFRLPTEAEWEYAARGGKYWEGGYEFAGSNKLKEVGWFDKNSHGETKPVGMKLPNALDLYDMSGNVWEWCGDWYGSYKESETDPRGAEKGSNRVIRGGSWRNLPQFCRVADRNGYHPGFRYDYIGFRLVHVFQAAG